MTETPGFPLPSSYSFGWIRGRFIQWILDTLADEDAEPEARPATGEIVLTPAESLRRVTDLDYPALVTSGRIVLPINPEDGTIRDANGSTTIALVTGIYRVEFNLTTGTIPTFSFEVTAEHTRELPLDLAAAAPVQPPSGTPTELLPVPVGGQPGQVLQMMADGSLAWGYPTESPFIRFDARPFLLAGWTSTAPIWLSRSGNVVSFEIDGTAGAFTGANATGDNFLTIPLGWRPSVVNECLMGTLIDLARSEPARIVPNNTGRWLKVQPVPVPRRAGLLGSVAWTTTDPWPTAIPTP